MAGELTPETVMAHVDRIMSARWQWGVSDCCVSAADVFNAVHGVDMASPYRGAYDSAIAAARLIRTWGGFRSMAQQMAYMSGLVPCVAMTGAIGVSAPGVSSSAEGRSMLICVRPGIWAGKSLDGYVILNNAERAWCVNSY